MLELCRCPNIYGPDCIYIYIYIYIFVYLPAIFAFIFETLNNWLLNWGRKYFLKTCLIALYTFAFQKIIIRLFSDFFIFFCTACTATRPHTHPHTVTCLHKHTSPKDIYVSVCQRCPSLQLCTWRSFHSYTPLNPDTCSHLHTLLTPQQPSHSTAPIAHYVPVPLCIWEHKYSTTAAVKLKQQVMKAPALSRANDWKVHLHFEGIKKITHCVNGHMVKGRH